MDHAHCVLDNQGYKHTICNTYCFYTATLVATKHLNVTLIRKLPVFFLAGLLHPHQSFLSLLSMEMNFSTPFFIINPLKPELNSICYLLALLGAHHFFHVGRIRVKLLTFRLLMSYIYIYGAPILDVSRSHTTTQHSR